MNLERLKTFRALSETLHVRRTAARLHLSQSAVSQQISTLEDELGVMLLERIGRRVFLTPAGRALADEASKILAAVDRAREFVRTYGSGESGGLRLGASTTPGVYLVPEVLGRFRSALPHVSVTLKIANSADIEQALVENDLDIGIIGEDITQEELFQVAIGDDLIVGVIAPALVEGAKSKTRRRQPTRVRVADLSKFPILAREAGSATQRYVERGLDHVGFRATPAFEFPSPEAQVRAAIAGLGLAFVSRRVAADALAAGSVVELAVRRLRMIRPITAAYHRDKHVSAAMRQLIDLARRQAHTLRSR
jgi:DNA-binding transcriptional LysR family regulator